MIIARQFRFEAAHRLPHHDGKCRRLHGHSYRLELRFSGQPRPVDPHDPQSGFVADFGRIRQRVQQGLIDPYLDHHDLIDALPDLPYTSAELLAAWIAAWCIVHLETAPDMAGVRLVAARLWETENAWAEADRADAEPFLAQIPPPLPEAEASPD